MKIKHSRQSHDGLVASFPHGNQFQYKGGKRRCRLRMSPYNQGSIRHLFIVAYRPLSFVYPNTTLAGTPRLWYMFLATSKLIARRPWRISLNAVVDTPIAFAASFCL